MSAPAQSDDDRELCDLSLAFFGAVTASISHELNNVISIIDQTNGLLEDMVVGQQQGVPVAVERLGDIAASIQRQIGRGLGIIKRLNRFAHSTDVPETQFDLNETIGNLCDLCQRLTDLKRAKLEFKAVAGIAVNTTGNPFLLQQAVFAIIRLFLQKAIKDDIITVEIKDIEKGKFVAIEGPCAETEIDDEELHEFKPAIAAYKSGFTVSYNQGRAQFEIALN